ncbi:NUDIX domain-containing protein [Candidatus Babeliales bacterium]|nr:NUDIX domain-containing protein [Candidatus Babeliales bacterium]
MDNKISVQRIATKAIIANEKNEILLVREARYDEGTNAGKHMLPGGRIEIGEPYLDGLKREVREETGLEVAVGAPVFVGEWFPVIKGVPTQIVAVFFACRALSSHVVLSAEHDQFMWVNPGQLGAYNMAPADVQAIQAFRDFGVRHYEKLEVSGCLEV